MSADTGDRISRIYGGFRGVDFRGEEVHLSRSPDSVNMWKDYRETESIRTRPAFVYRASIPITKDEPLYGVHWFNGNSRSQRGAGPSLYIHYGTHLVKAYVDNDGYISALIPINEVVMNPERSASYVYNGELYILNGNKFFHVEDDTKIVNEIEPYIPTTTIGRKPAGGGTTHEDVNLLTARRKNTFLADGESTYFVVDGKMAHWKEVIVKVNGKVMPSDDNKNWTIAHNDVEYGVRFTKAPPAPLTDGQDNVEIEYEADIVRDKTLITACTKSHVFDNRVFVYGNPNHPNRMWHCALNNPTYFSDLDYYDEGQDRVAITALVSGNNALWVFRKPSSTNANIFYHTPTIDSDYGKIYPSTHSNAAIGCVGAAINFNDTIVYFSNRGMEGINGDITNEQSVTHKSSLVDKKLLSEENYENMILAECEGYLFVIFDNRMYLADSRAVFTNSDHLEYEWFYWEAPHKIIHAMTYDGRMYLIYENGTIVTLHLKHEKNYILDFFLTESGEVSGKRIDSRWVTPKDRFNAPQKLKTTNKRGCVVEAAGDITVLVKTEDTEFEEVGTYENVTDYFCCRIKRKKWKDIQLKFESDRKFSLETATLEAFIGGYIKR